MVIDLIEKEKLTAEEYKFIYHSELLMTTSLLSESIISGESSV